MYIEYVPNRNSKPAVLLRESYRQGSTVCKRTLANLTQLPPDQIEAIRQILKGKKLLPIEQIIQILPDGSRHHGHVQAVLTAIKHLAIPRLISSRHSHQRNLVIAMIAARLIEPQSKLATTRWWHTTTLPELLNVQDASEVDLYDAMDWLLEKQDAIEKKLANRHLNENGLALYDLTSSYFEGTTCPLASLGHNRDGKKGKLQVNYGLLTNQKGIPVSVSVFKGNSGDPSTLLPQVERLREVFGMKRVVLVGDRGMITQKQVDTLGKLEGMDWIGALRPEAIKKLVEGEVIQMGLFDERNLFELVRHPDYPNERLIACRNSDLMHKRARKRESLIEATVKELNKVQAMVERGKLVDKEEIAQRAQRLLKSYKIGKFFTVEVQEQSLQYEVDEAGILRAAKVDAEKHPDRAQKRLERMKRHQASLINHLNKLKAKTGRGRLYGAAKIGLRTGKVLNKYKMAKHFNLTISDNSFAFEIDQEKVAAEAALDGIYVIRTSLDKESMDRENVVRSYKLLSQVEHAFRTFKGIDLKVRPIYHRMERRVKAHIFLCMLAYYVQWHMMQAWRPLLFADEDQEAKTTRDPVAPAQRSKEAITKVTQKHLKDGSSVHSFHTLLSQLSTIVRNKCRGAAKLTIWEMVTPPNPKQEKAFELLKSMKL